MLNIVEFFHCMAEKNFSGLQGGYRVAVFVHYQLNLNSIAIALQSLIEIARDLRQFESPGAASDRTSNVAQKLDGIANDLQISKQKHNAFCSKSASEMTLEILNAVLRGKVKFLQIGGDKGYLHDPIYKFIKAYDWEGVIVEPVPEYFEKLRRTYEDQPRVQYVNAAIDAQAGRRENV